MFGCFVSLVAGFSFAQNGTGQTIPESRFGWHLPTSGHLHCLVVFAEVDYDSTFGRLDPTPKEGMWRWKSGQLPAWKDELFDSEISSQPKGFFTRYFSMASFGNYQVTGDYLEEVITLPMSKMRDSRGNIRTKDPYARGVFREKLVQAINDRGIAGIKKNRQVSAFDNWTLTGKGTEKVNSPNGKIDMVIVVWRNIHVAGLASGSGYAQDRGIGKIWGMNTEASAIFGASDALPYTIMRHEFSHLLFGGNNFHTASGAVGTRTFLAKSGGYSCLSNSDRCMEVWNGWDRERMGWQHPANEFLLSARNDRGEEIDGLLEYGKPFSHNSIIVLRDFYQYGDVLKIPLPHLPENKKRQYLWVENHQQTVSDIGNKKMRNGLYCYIQVGKDKMIGKGLYGGDGNYTSPLVAVGNYDCQYENFNKKDATFRMDDEWANSFTGYNYLQIHPYDLNRDGVITEGSGWGKHTEGLFGANVLRNNKPMGVNYFAFKTFPMWGTKGIAFHPDGNFKIGISHNPAAVPMYTHRSPGGPVESDNRKIYLNGISIEILRQEANGDMYLRVKWDDFVVDRNVRWCGHIVCKEQINIKPNRLLNLDQGRSAQEHKLIRVVDGDSLFMKPSVLDLKPGSITRLGRGAKLIVNNGSTLIIRKDAKLIMGKKSNVMIGKGAFLYIEEGAIIEDDQGNWGGNQITVGTNGSKGVHPLVKEDVGELGRMR